MTQRAARRGLATGIRTSARRRAAAAALALLLAPAGARAQTLEELGAANDKSAEAIAAGDFAGAAGFAQQALEIGEKVLAPTDERLAVLAYNAGLLDEKIESWSAAAAAFARTVELRGTLRGKKSPELIDPLRKLALAQGHSQRFAEAYATGERAFALIEAQSGSDSLEVADASAALALAALQDKHAKRADRHLRTALAIYKTAKGESSLEVARVYLGLAFVQFQSQQPSEGFDYFGKAAKIFESVPDGQPDKLRMLEQRVQVTKALGREPDQKLVDELERNRAAAPAYKANAESGPPKSDVGAH